MLTKDEYHCLNRWEGVRRMKLSRETCMRLILSPGVEAVYFLYDLASTLGWKLFLFGGTYEKI